MSNKKRRCKKTSVVLVAVFALLMGSFTTAYAADIFNFTIIRGNKLTSGTIYKTKSCSNGKVQVTSASAPGYNTTYWIYDGVGGVMTPGCSVKNTSGTTANIRYFDKDKYKSDTKTTTKAVCKTVLKGMDTSLMAPNYSTVKGVWTPVA